MSHSKIFQRNRALGFVSNHIPLVTRYIQRRNENLIVTCTGRSFHTYSASHFTLLTVSPAHPEDITCLGADTYHVYTASGNTIYAWRRGNELKHTYRGHESTVHLLLPFGAHLVSIDEDSNLKIWDIKLETIESELNFKNDVFKVTSLMHPHTLKNKILLGSEQGKMQLWNIKTMKLIHTFEGWNHSITIIEQAPAPHVVAVGLINGQIILHNVTMDKTLFKLVQDWGMVTSISFRTDDRPIMATGSLEGHIVLWNLEERKMESQILNAHFGSVTGMNCLPKEPLLVSSSADNTLKLWIFDLTDGAGRLLRIREGHSEPPTIIRFYGNDGHNILSASHDSSLRIFSTQTETFNKSLGRASYNRKASKKKGRLVEDPLIMPPIIDFAAEKTREKDWDNIAAAHLGLGMVTTWSYDKLKMGEHKLLPEKFKFNLNVTATTLTLTQCGNFVVIGYNNGHVVRFNIQSGEHRSSYGGEKGAHNGPVKGINVDCLNVTVVTAGRDATVKFWPFKPLKDTQPKKEIDVKESVDWLRSHKENSLISVALKDFTILVIDLDMQRIIRCFEGHSGRLTDATFSPDSRWLITASMDRTIRIWDVPSAQLIDVFQVPSACISLTFSPTGEFLATAHVCNLGIYLWSNRTLYSHISLKAVRQDEQIPLITLPGCTADKIESMENNESMHIDDDTDSETNDEYVSPEQLNSKLITMSNLATYRLLNLLNIDIVKKRNKPKEALKAPAAPFFLPTVAGLQLQFDFSDVKSQEENSKLLVHPDFQNLTPFGQMLQKTIDTHDFNEPIKKLNSMGPSSIDLEIQSLAFNMNCTVPMLLQFLKMITFMLESNEYFNLVQFYLALFIKCHGTIITEEKELANYLDEMIKLHGRKWKKFRERDFYALSVLKQLDRT